MFNQVHITLSSCLDPE
jgi:origin recognition complex subunit 1